MASKRMKSSCLWSYFTVIEVNNKKCQCDLCRLVLFFLSTTNNLKRLIERRHVTVKLNAGSKKDTVGYDSTINDITDNRNLPVSVNSTVL